MGIHSTSVGMGLPSTGSPITFQMRPRVSFPTGIMIGAPVSTASIPRTMPSVEVMATVRTRSPGRCVCTSSTVLISPEGVVALTVKAL